MRSTLWLPIVLAIVVVVIVVGIVMIPPADQAGSNTSNLSKINGGGRTSPLSPPTPVVSSDTAGGPGAGSLSSPDLVTGQVNPESAVGAELIAGGTAAGMGLSSSGAGIGAATAGAAAPASSDPAGIKGVVQNVQEIPLVDARVEISGQDPVTTGPGGVFAVTGLTGETVSLSVQKEGYQTLTQEVRVGNDKLKLVLVREGSLAGRVINQTNDPVPLANIHMQAQEGIWARDFTADQNGKFEVSDAPDGMLTVKASLEGFEETGDAQQTVQSPSPVELVLRLKQPMFSISGRVVRQDNQQGVGGFKLTAKPEGVSDQAALKNTVSDGSGFYRIEDLPRGTYLVSSQAGDNSLQNWVVPLDQDFKTVRIYEADAENIDFAVVNGCEVSGQVLTEGGQPVGGAEVYVAKLGSPRTVSSANGNYRLTGVPVFSSEQGQKASDFPIQIYATHAQYGSGSSETLTTAPGQKMTGIVVTLLGAAQISGNVVDTNGAAVAGAQVVLQDQATGQTQQVQTDATGAFRFDQVASAATPASPMQGTHTLEAFKEGMGRVRKELVIASGEQRTITLTLQAGGSVQGRATDPGGKGVAGAQVITWLTTGGTVSAQTDVLGIYRLESLPEGQYDIAFRLEGQPSLTGQLYSVPVGSTNADVMMTPNEWIMTGTVMDQSSGLPVQQLHVTVRGAPQAPNGRPFVETKLFNTPDGTYQIKVHEPGLYHLNFAADGYQPQEGSVSISPTYTERQFLNILLTPVQQTGGITGTFDPPPGTVLAAVSLVGYQTFPTGGNSFVVENVPVGRHDLLFFVRETETGAGYSVGAFPAVPVDPNQVTQLPPISYSQLQPTRGF